MVINQKQLYLSNKIKHFGYNDGYGVQVSKCLKEELDLSTDKRLRVISNLMLFKI